MLSFNAMLALSVLSAALVVIPATMHVCLARFAR